MLEGVSVKNVFLGLVGADGALGDQERGMFFADGQANAGEEARDNPAVGVGEHGAQQDAAGVGVKMIVKGLDDAVMGKTLLVGQLELDGGAAVGVGLDFLGGHEGVEAQEGVFIHVGIDVNGGSTETMVVRRVPAPEPPLT